MKTVKGPGYQKLTPYQKAVMWSNIEIAIRNAKAAAKRQDLISFNTAADDLSRLGNVLRRHETALAIENAEKPTIKDVCDKLYRE